MDEAFEDSWNNLMEEAELDSTGRLRMMVRRFLITTTIQLNNGTHLSHKL